MTHHRQPTIHEAARSRAAWCECESHCYDPVYMPDDFCPCGEDKHHYHCPACGGISQVG